MDMGWTAASTGRWDKTKFIENFTKFSPKDKVYKWRCWKKAAGAGGLLNCS